MSDFAASAAARAAVGLRHGRVELLLRDLVLRDQRLEPLDVARRLGRRRLLLALPRLRGDKLARAALDLLLGACDCRPRLPRTPPDALLTPARVSTLRDRHARARRPSRSACASASSARARSTATW